MYEKLNDLAADGWEYVGPLGNSMIAFKRSRATLQQIAAKKELASGRVPGKATATSS